MTDLSAIKLLRGGVDLFPALIEAMDAAQHEVRLETYIFDVAGTGADVAHALVRAAARGVAVYVLVDGAGTGEMPAEWAHRFEQAGVQLRVYSPVNLLGVFMPSRWRRLHRKLCVIDRTVSFCGGINILDDFFNPHAQDRLLAPRLDYAVRATGELAAQVHDTMLQLWSRVEAMRELRQQGLSAAFEVLQDKGKDKNRTQQSVAHNNVTQSSNHLVAQLLLRDNLRHRSQIERAYRKAIGEARHEVLIASAYFFPAMRLRRALVMAAQRGVRVRLLLQGRYEYWAPYRASQQLYGQLLAAGVEIYEYHASFLHAKVAVVDEKWVTVGSSNLDPLSLLLAREANVVTNDVALSQALRQSLDQAMELGANRVDPQTYLNRGWRQRLGDAFGSAMLRFGVFLTGKRY
jgi:cardiolipin synthase